ncbi:titin-like [Onthophagus taurus]|uniref:titin-like n=1 Tax=Onthophagus taurus TaxID=166361 RepID=UPI000C20078C|nr:uncharacterized protein LOC111414809 [Onthophagus taurus]
MTLVSKKLYFQVICLLCAICVAQIGTSSSSEEIDVALPTFESSRALKDEFNMDNKWKAVDPVPLDTSGWIPELNPQPETVPKDGEVPKRRRIRKRKRRPPMVSLTETQQNQEEEKTLPTNTRRRPQLEEQQMWNEMIHEERVTNYKRRRIIPTYQPHIEKDDVKEGTQTEKGVLIDNEALNLKMLLKQAGSLSEILQKRNLTLSDLLNGEKKALYALTEKTNEVESITEYKNPVEEEHEIEIITKPPEKPEIVKEVNVQSLFINQNNLKYNVNVSSNNQEKPNKLGNIIVIDYKPNINEFGNDFYRESTSHAESSTKAPKTSQTIRLPVTNAKLNRYSIPRIIPNKNNSPHTPEPPKPYSIPVSELLNILMGPPKETKKEDEPLRMSFDLNKVSEEKNKFEDVTEAIKTIELLRTTGLIRTTERIPEKIAAITAKDEIFEILKDINTKESLTKILTNRNMTIDDLVELRERGSSQKHLADLFHNKTKEPEPEKVFIGKFVHFKPTERVPKSRRPTEVVITTKKSTTESSDEENLEENQDKSKYTITSFPTYKIEMDKKYKEVISETIWKDYDKLYHSTHQKGTVENLDEIEDVLTVNDEISSNSISENGNEKLNIDERDKLQDEEGNIFIKLPYGVKHAILASLLIIGVSLFIFVTILVIFKWSQKHKRRLCYNGSFSCTKFNSILEDGQKRTFKTFVSETLGRKKHFYKQHLQSMSDTWENDKKPFQ